ncbi:MAG: MBL fold metallo-hydrolase, partial [Bdellovibrionales bacterium]|nr:MBL fold metallo-hydrolase [Bdellovibrionales bacterium]
LTHAHIDHAGGVSEIIGALGESQGTRPQLLAHPKEKEMRQSISRQALLYGLSPLEYRDVEEPDRYLEHGDTLEVGGVTGEVLFVPGHSPGHIALYFPSVCVGGGNPAEAEMRPVLIAGDTIFAGSIGRTDLPGGDTQTLLSSIKNHLLTLPDQTLVLSGHGPDTTIGRERVSNPFLVGMAEGE